MVVDLLLERICQWGSTQQQIRAIALVGSYARDDAEEHSDIDLVIIAEYPAHFVEELIWIHTFGEVGNHQLEDYGLVQSVRVWYEEGFEVEFGITGLDWIAEPKDEGTRRVIWDGVRVLFERDELLSESLGKII
jgi:predicted nucleotidyltransferase